MTMIAVTSSTTGAWGDSGRWHAADPATAERAKFSSATYYRSVCGQKYQQATYMPNATTPTLFAEIMHLEQCRSCVRILKARADRSVQHVVHCTPVGRDVLHGAASTTEPKEKSDGEEREDHDSVDDGRGGRAVDEDLVGPRLGSRSAPPVASGTHRRGARGSGLDARRGGGEWFT